MGAATTISSLDSRSVKQQCRLSLHLGREEARSRSMLPETLHVRSHRGRGRGVYYGAGGHRDGGAQEFTEVNLSHELYLAPEMMYASLDLAGLVVEATKDLPSTCSRIASLTYSYKAGTQIFRVSLHASRVT